MSLLSVPRDTLPPSSLDRDMANHVCPCACLSTAAIRFFTLVPSVEAGCAVTLASSKSVQAHVWRDLGGQMAGLLMGTVLLVIANDSDQ